MKRLEVIAMLEQVREARQQFAKAQATFNSDVDAMMRRLLHEAAHNYMSPEEVARASGFTTKRVRAIMRAIGLNPRDGKTLLSKKAAEALVNNAELLGIEPRDMDLMSPLAYLPMGSVLKRELQDRTVSQVHEVSGNEHDEFFAKHYSDWNVHALTLTVYVPTKEDDPAESLALVQEILDRASFDIKVSEQ